MIGNKGDAAESLTALAEVAATLGQPESAARLYGAAQSLGESADAPLSSADVAEKNPSVSSLRAALGEEAFRAAWQEGRSMPLAQALNLSLGPALQEFE